MSARFLDIHLLQTVPYANLNRDDLGAPKEAVYGGVPRTRVSSQCWKRAVRLDVEERLRDSAVRTRRIVKAVGEELVGMGWPAELAERAGLEVVWSAADGLKLEDDGLTTSVLLFLPRSSVAQLAKLAEEYRDEIEAAAATGEKKPTKKGKNQSVLPADRVNAALSGTNDSIHLFGRMLAELPSATVDGAVQVAHAFTTHTVETQVDFFTAVDDIPGTDAGSGHMNSAEFSAGVFYRYACVDVAGLAANLDSDPGRAWELAGLFAESFITAMPGAKKTSTAPHTVPDLAYLAARADRPLSLAGAFEKPVRGSAGFAEPSRTGLANYASRLRELLGDAGHVHHGYATLNEYDLPDLGVRYASFPALVAALIEAGEGKR